MKKKILLHFILITAMLYIAGCAASARPVSKYEFVLDTVAGITIYSGGGDDEIDEAFALCRRYESMLSSTISGSDIERLNSAGGEWTSVSDDTIELLKAAVYYGDLSDGAFDVTVYPVSLLWDFQSEDASVPDDELIYSALSHVNYKNIQIDEAKSRVRLLDPDSMVELGAIAKGYIADRMKELLLERGVKKALINLGGNVLAIGSSKDGSAFKIGIAKPFSESGEILDSVGIIDSSAVTSGNYQRYFTQGGVIYHHILDPKSGYPARSGINGVTVLTKNSVDADALSTILFILGPKRGRDLIESIGDVSAIFVDEKNNIIQ